jgi:hypothetical protein
MNQKQIRDKIAEIQAEQKRLETEENAPHDEFHDWMLTIIKIGSLEYAAYALRKKGIFNSLFAVAVFLVFAWAFWDRSQAAVAIYSLHTLASLTFHWQYIFPVEVPPMKAIFIVGAAGLICGPLAAIFKL